MTFGRFASAASGVLAGMSKTPAVEAGTTMAAPSPADDVDRIFPGYMAHQPAVHHYPQNPFTAGGGSDYYGDGTVYYPHQYSLYVRMVDSVRGLTICLGMARGVFGGYKYAFG